ncbi:hypothetical protein [Sediminitomix flava]|nr:hypothetical protein [Sediminitomix flava]
MKKILLADLYSRIKDQGFKLYRDGENSGFIKRENGIVVGFQLEFYSTYSSIAFSGISMGMERVEEIIREVNKPNGYPDKYLDINSEYFLPTIRDIKIPLMDGLSYKDEASTLRVSGLVVNYLANSGGVFVDKFSYMPNVLIVMDILTSKGLRWHDKSEGILSGTIDAYFRGLIISKLCNDPDFTNKIEMVDQFLSRPVPRVQEWQSYYLKLKEKLSEIEPIYNL